MDSARPSEDQSSVISELSRSNPIVARVLRRWRALTGVPNARDTDRRTLVALSGGADSTALSAILATVTPKPILAHIVHDLRDASLAAIDRDAAAQIASDLGCVFHEQSIQIKSLPGNAEHNARQARYTALCDIAHQESVQYIATGHHAEDQLETVLMNISRGCGAHGLAGIHDSRLVNGCTVVRPMLGVQRAELIQICRTAGLAWVHDHTNDDLSMTRNKVRHQLLPEILAFDPEFAARANQSADAVRSMVQAMDQLVSDHVWTLGTILPDSLEWSRQSLRRQADASLYVLLRQCALHLNRGNSQVNGLDSMTKSSVESSICAITDSSTEPRVCRVGPIVVSVQANSVTVTLSDSV